MSAASDNGKRDDGKRDDGNGENGSLPRRGSVGPALDGIARDAVAGDSSSDLTVARRKKREQRVDDVQREMATRDAATKRNER
jgi:hypothetical protein